MPDIERSFLPRKTPVSSSEQNQANLESNQQALEKATFKCGQCDAIFKTRNDLKIQLLCLPRIALPITWKSQGLVKNKRLSEK